MKKRTIVKLILVFALLVVGIYFYFNLSGDKVCFRSNCINVEIAETDEEKAEGLMNRRTLGENKGMIFLYEVPGRYSFWMKNTLIPLDIIWINQDREVVFIRGNAQPCPKDEGACPSIVPNKDASYVLEVNAGKVDELGVQVGDVLEFKNVI
jgi:uncharacterized protein